MVYGNNVGFAWVCLHREPLSFRCAASSATKPFTFMLPQKLEWVLSIMTKQHSVTIRQAGADHVTITKIKDRNRRVAAEMRPCDTKGSTLFFMVIISATHKPVQSGLLKPTQLAQAGAHRSSHRVCKRGQYSCRQISPIIQKSIIIHQSKSTAGKTKQGNGKWNG